MEEKVRLRGKGRFRQLITENRWLKMVPNMLTLCNSLCGFAAILYTLRAYENTNGNVRIFAATAWIILFAMVFDALDGFAARIFNAASMHGIQMDSLADMVTFGLAPAVTLAIMTHTLRSELGRMEVAVYGLCAVYLGGAALRLATYNVHAILEKKSGDTFSGLPTPGGAAAICSIFLYAPSCEMQLEKYAWVLPVYAAVLGLLMVSPIRYMHFGKWLFSAGRNHRRMALLLAMLIFILYFRAAGLLVLVTGYVFSGPAMALWRRFRPVKPGGE